MENLQKTLLYYVKEVENNTQTFIKRKYINKKVQAVCSNIRIKAPIRFLLSCCVAKIDNSEVDVRKPYTEIKGKGTFSGRSYDEKYVQEIIEQYDLPCNITTAYLTPAFRNRNTMMLPHTELVGRNPELYRTTLEILDLVYKKEITPEQLFKEIIRQLFIMRDQNASIIEQLMKGIKETYKEGCVLSSEQIVTLLIQHLASKNSSRLPVLIVAAAYKAVADIIEENIMPLQMHNAADKQTGTYGDIEVILPNDNNIVTIYEMKDKKVTKSDIRTAIKKITKSKIKIDNYIFVTTDTIEKEIEDYAKSIYTILGVEIVILDCIGFIKHFLHFFHRRRIEFLENYQKLVLAEPNSSVSQPLKEVFLVLRRVAETDNN